MPRTHRRAGRREEAPREIRGTLGEPVTAFEDLTDVLANENMADHFAQWVNDNTTGLNRPLDIPINTINTNWAPGLTLNTVANGETRFLLNAGGGDDSYVSFDTNRESVRFYSEGILMAEIIHDEAGMSLHIHGGNNNDVGVGTYARMFLQALTEQMEQWHNGIQHNNAPAEETPGNLDVNEEPQ